MRTADAVTFGRQHIRRDADGVTRFAIVNRKTGTVSRGLVLAPLAAAIAAGPCGDLTFIKTAHGRARSHKAFSAWFADKARAAGVPGAGHGLRKAGATFAAEEGATVRDLMEMFGWRNEAEAVLYTRAASSIRLSDSAGRALERGLIGNVVLSHPISGATKSGKK